MMIGVSHLFHFPSTFIHTFSPLEKQLEDEDALEKNLNKAKESKFKGEDEVDSEEERKKAKEEEKKKQEENKNKGEKKAKKVVKDYDEMFEKRLNKGGQANNQK